MKIENKFRLKLIDGVLFYNDIPVVEIDEYDGSISRIKLNLSDILSLRDMGINTDVMTRESFETVAVLWGESMDRYMTSFDGYDYHQMMIQEEQLFLIDQYIINGESFNEQKWTIR